MFLVSLSLPFFFFNDTATTEIYTLSLHDALPICNPSDSDGRSGPPARSRAIFSRTRGRSNALGLSEHPGGDNASPAMSVNGDGSYYGHRRHAAGILVAGEPSGSFLGRDSDLRRGREFGSF